MLRLEISTVANNVIDERQHVVSLHELFGVLHDMFLY